MKKILILCLILAQAQLIFADESENGETIGGVLKRNYANSCTGGHELNIKNSLISAVSVPTCVSSAAVYVVGTVLVGTLQATAGSGRRGGCISCGGGMAVTVATEIATAGPQGAVSSEILRDQSFQDAAFYLKQDGFAGETVYDYAMEILRLAEQ